MLDNLLMHGSGRPRRNGRTPQKAGLPITGVTGTGTSHLDRYREAMEARAATQGAGQLPAGPDDSASIDRLAMLMGDLGPLCSAREDEWGGLLDSAPPERVGHLVGRPAFLVALARPEELEKPLAGIRPGRSLVHLGLRRSADLAVIAGSAAALLGGRHRIGAARNLLVSLIFGLLEIARNAPERVTIAIEGAEALARHLVLRMANARAAALDADGGARRRTRIERVFRKLGLGPADLRTLYRDLSLSAAACEECLEWLEANNLVRRAGRTWERVEGARLRLDAANSPLLETACAAIP